MPKHKVKVTLVAETEVEIEVDVEEGDDPTDLLPEDEQNAINAATSFPDWEVDDVEEVK